jgi:membrane fusion protein (multidrug efflux system)
MLLRTLSSALLLTACSVGVDGAGSSSGPPPPVEVVSQRVRLVEVPVVEQTLFTLLPDAELLVRAEAPGQIATVSFQDGEVVPKGAELMRLRDAAWQADLASTEAAYTLAASELERAAALHSKERISTAELQAAQARHDLAQAEVDRAREALRRTVIHTPFGGRLGRRLVEPGDVVDMSTVITRLVDADPLRAELSIPERHAGWVALGQAVQLALDAWPEQRFDAEVVYIEPAVDPATRTLLLRAVVVDPEHKLSPGMSGRAEITLRAPEPQVVVPAAAVTTRASGPMVWVVVDGLAQVRPVVLGPRRPQDVVVRSGLSEGEEVVVEGLVRLREGAAVTSRITEVSP